MSESFLTTEWVAAVPAVADALNGSASEFSGTIGFEITDAPDGKLRAHVVVVNGQIESAAAAKSKEAQCTIGLSAETAQAILLGELEWKAAYMRGDLKLSDGYELVLYRSNDLTGTDEWPSFVAALVAATTF